MAPASTLDYSEPCQQWRYPKIYSVTADEKTDCPKSTVESNGKEANSAYKKFCKFLRRLSNKKRKSTQRLTYSVLKSIQVTGPFYKSMFSKRLKLSSYIMVSKILIL